MGILSQFLFQRKEFETKLIEIDKESVQYLLQKFPDKALDIAEGDFLRIGEENLS